MVVSYPFVFRNDAIASCGRMIPRVRCPGGRPMGWVTVLAVSLLGSSAGWKHGIKLTLWRLTRFSTMRYDRLLADLAEMNAQLARRLFDTEEELARLREDLERRDGSRS